MLAHGLDKLLTLFMLLAKVALWMPLDVLLLFILFFMGILVLLSLMASTSTTLLLRPKIGRYRTQDKTLATDSLNDN